MVLLAQVKATIQKTRRHIVTAVTFFFLVLYSDSMYYRVARRIHDTTVPRDNRVLLPKHKCDYPTVFILCSLVCFIAPHF